MNILGLMSGTSLDGLDLCVCSFNTEGTTYQIGSVHTETYPEHIVQLIQKAYQASGQDLVVLDTQYTEWLANYVHSYIQKLEEQIHLISSHGHTVYHQPGQGLTLQIGNLPMLSEITGLPVVCDFRTQDVQLGGQGAPLVPIGDEMLFSEYTYCLNLGGFSNVSYHQSGLRLAYDIGPCNLVLNQLAQKAHRPYDEDGALARSGEVIPELLKRLMTLPYFDQKPPKSLGREWLEEQVWPIFQDYDHRKVSDQLRTATEWIGAIIGENLLHNGSCLITGGGAYNRFLLACIEKNTSVELVLPDDKLIEYKEALIFALLGKLRWENKVNILASVTGATGNHCSGKVYVPSKNQ